MRCVVLGATGYLGTPLVPELISAGHAAAQPDKPAPANLSAVRAGQTVHSDV